MSDYTPPPFNAANAGAVSNATFDPTDIFTSEDGITAHAGGGKASATQLSATKFFHRISTVANGADSVLMPPATAGQMCYVRNDGAQFAQVFGQGTDTINGIATATGNVLQNGSGALFFCTTAGAWTTANGIGQLSGSTLNVGGAATIDGNGIVKARSFTAPFNIPVLELNGADNLLYFTTASQIVWGTALFSKDTGLSRSSAGVVKVTNGSSGEGLLKLGSFIVSGLPSAATAGAGTTAFVTDGSTTVILGLGLTVVGGGSNKVPVYSDGTNWIVG